MALVASVRGYAPPVAVEFARKLLWSDVRPSFADLENHLKGKKKEPQKEEARRRERTARSERPIIIVKRLKKGGSGHHGGAWKVAYADFVTAMMAFFMVMWLVASVIKEKRAAIFDYFKNPSMEQGKSPRAGAGPDGSGRRQHQRDQHGRRPGCAQVRQRRCPPDWARRPARMSPTTADKAAPDVEDEAQEDRRGGRAQETRIADGGAARGHRQEPGAQAVQGSAAARHHARGPAHPDRRCAEPADVRSGQRQAEGLHRRTSCTSWRRT